MLSLTSLPSPNAERRRQQRDAALVPGSRPLPASGVAFEPTSTARLDETMRELVAFSPHVRAAMAAALEHAAALEAAAARLRAQMAVPLPRVWAPVDGSPSQCEPRSPRATHDYPSGRVGGGSVDDAALAAAADAAGRQLRHAVAGPLERWLDALDVASARLESVERARLGLDAARREAEARFAEDERRAHAAFAALRDPTAATAAAGMAAEPGGGGAAGGGGGGRFFGAATDVVPEQYGRGLLGRRRRHDGSSDLGPGGAAAAALFGGGSGAAAGSGGAAAAAVGPSAASARGALFLEQARTAELEEAALRRAQHERALQAIRASYEEQERLAFEMLSGLARDSARLKAYYLCSLLSAMVGCQRLALALGPAKLPLPGSSAAPSAGADGGAGAAAASDAYGRIGSVERDVLAASPLARELARGVLPPTRAEAVAGGGGRAPAPSFGAPAAAAAPLRVVVRRAVATPMAVGADTTLEGRAPVPPPPPTTAAKTAAAAKAAAGPPPATSAVVAPTPGPPPVAAAAVSRPTPGFSPAEAQVGGGAVPASAAAASLLRPMAGGALHEEEEEEEEEQPRQVEVGAVPAAAAATSVAATTTPLAAPFSPPPVREEQQQHEGVGEGEEEEFAEARSRPWTRASSVDSGGGGAATAAVRETMAAGGGGVA
jgi:hypothetical protein